MNELEMEKEIMKTLNNLFYEIHPRPALKCVLSTLIQMFMGLDVDKEKAKQVFEDSWDIIEKSSEFKKLQEKYARKN